VAAGPCAAQDCGRRGRRVTADVNRDELNRCRTSRHRSSRHRCHGAACGSTAPTVAETPPLIVEDPVDAAQAGHIVGKVTFDGTPPPPEPISMRSDPYCEREHPDGATVQRIKTGPDAGLQNVFVYVAAGLEGLRFPVPSTPVVLDQQRCTYEPRVFGIQVGQPLELLNSDATLHNVHAAAVANQEFNRGQANRGDRHTHVFSTREVMVPFKCDVPQMDERLGRRPRPSVLLVDNRRRRVSPRAAAPGHVYHRSLARSSRGR
jgi:plastocyanin